MSNSALLHAPINQLKKKIDLLSGPTDVLETLLTTAWTKDTLRAWLSVDANRAKWEYLWSMSNAGPALANNAVLMAAMYSDEDNASTIYSSIAANQATQGSKVAREALAAVTQPAAVPWVRPADWLALPELTDTDKKFVGLFGIEDNDSNFLALSAGGNYTVDWGDGVVENRTANVVANHKYNYAAISNSTLSTEGYKQVIVTVTPQAGQLFTNIDISRRHSQLNLNQHDNGWLDIAVSGSNLTAVVVCGQNNNISLRQINIKANAVTNFYYDLNSLGGLKTAIINTNKLTNATYMFASCKSLQHVYLSDTSKVTDMSYMFNGCFSLLSVSSFDTGNVTTMLSMFTNCKALVTVPLFNTVKVITATYMFNGCISLSFVPLFDTSAMFYTDYMFQGCYALKSVPLFNTGLVTNMSYMFNNCYSLKSIPLFNTSNVVTMPNMFSNCYSLKSIPLFNTAKVTNISGMFNGCGSLQLVPLFNTTKVTNMSTMFANCVALQLVPLFDTSLVTNMSSMFSGCYSLTSVPLFNTINVTNMASMFYECFSLRSAPLFNTSLVTNMGNMFYNCSALKIVIFDNVSNVTSLSNIFACPSLVTLQLNGAKYQFSCSGSMLSRSSLETMFSYLGKSVGQTVTVSSNWGVDTPVSGTATLTSGSNVASMANTSGLTVGMLITGAGISPQVPVSFDASNSTVNKVSHGLANDAIVSFSTITTTTGVVISTRYFVVNSLADSFQVALTAGGLPIALTANGTGNILYGTYITSITPNTSITMSASANAVGAQTLTFRLLDISMATTKGWTVVA